MVAFDDLGDGVWRPVAFAILLGKLDNNSERPSSLSRVMDPRVTNPPKSGSPDIQSRKVPYQWGHARKRGSDRGKSEE